MKEFLQALEKSIQTSDLVFPTSLQASMSLQQAFADPDCHIDALHRLLQTEPVLVARIMALANSVAYNSGGRAITHLRQAMDRLGLRTLQALAAAVLVRQLAGAIKEPQLANAAYRLWVHTTQVTALARLIAARVTFQDTETALFAALMHELSGFYLLYRAVDWPHPLFEPASEFAAAWSRMEAPIGRALMQVMGIPEPIKLAMEDYWQGYLRLPPNTLGDTLLLAERLATEVSPLVDVSAFLESASSSSAHSSRTRDEPGHMDGASETGKTNEVSSIVDQLVGEKMLSDILQQAEAETQSLLQALDF